MRSWHNMTSQVTASEAIVLLEGVPTDEELAVIPETFVAGIGEVTLPVTENTTPTPHQTNHRQRISAALL